MIGETNAGSGALVYYLGTGTSFNVSGIPGYSNLTADNFIVEGTAGSASGTCAYGNRKALDGAYSSSTSLNVSVGSYSKAYNASTGVLTISNPTLSASVSGTSSYHSVSGSASAVLGAPKVYLIKGKIKSL